mmetsp:Transcript_49982/g.165502  ORF Transcript_49982/g.165502 Transcript_49982/m.165502 type:complete len:221 (+) Transcript_49982:1117-1779(+)
MKVVGGEDDLRGVEDGARVRVRPAEEVRVHVAARDVVEHKAEVVLGLEGEAERHDEGVLHAREHLLLTEDGVRLVLRDEDALVDHLDRVHALALALPRQQHHAKAARTQEAVEVKVANPDDVPVVAVQRLQRAVVWRLDEARKDVHPHRAHHRRLHHVEQRRRVNCAPARAPIRRRPVLNRSADLVHRRLTEPYLLRRALLDVFAIDLACHKASVIRGLD